MIFLELALGIAIGFLILVFVAAAIHIAVWLLLILAVLAGVGFLIIKFPIEILVAILIIEGMILLTIALFKGLIAMGRRARLALFDKPRPPFGGSPS
ncbi:MAG: hypothetical protein HY053_02435 [Proteobacteria bacterium]|nr:hypothetical protein [Pseudomonadota bacterium]